MDSESRVGPISLWGRLRQVDLVLVATIAGAGALRFIAIGTQSLWWDEFVTIEVIDRPLGEVLTAVQQHEGMPPLYYFAASAWVKVFGAGDVAVRSLSALIGVLTVPVVYATALQLGLSRRAARVAAVLTAVNPMLVWYSQEARAYALFVLLGAVSVYCFTRAVRRGTDVDVLLWGISGVAVVCTHYFAFFLVAVQALCLLVASPGRWRRVLAACVPIGLAFAALVPLASSQRATNQQSWIDDTALGLRARAAGRHLLVGPVAPDGRLWFVAAVIVLVAAWLLWARGTRSERAGAALMAGLGTLVCLLPLLVAVGGADYFLDRNVIIAVVPFVVAVAAGLGTRRGGRTAVVCFLGLCAISIVTVAAMARDGSSQRADWRAVAEQIDRDGTGSVVVLNTNGFLGLPLLRYMDEGRELGATETTATRQIEVVHLSSPTDTDRSCSWWVGQVCVFEQLTPGLPEALAQRFSLVDERRAGQFTIAVYQAEEPVPVARADLVGADVVRPGQLGGWLILLAGALV